MMDQTKDSPGNSVLLTVPGNLPRNQPMKLLIVKGSQNASQLVIQQNQTFTTHAGVPTVGVPHTNTPAAAPRSVTHFVPQQTQKRILLVSQKSCMPPQQRHIIQQNQTGFVLADGSTESVLAVPCSSTPRTVLVPNVVSQQTPKRFVLQGQAGTPKKSIVPQGQRIPVIIKTNKPTVGHAQTTVSSGGVLQHTQKRIKLQDLAAATQQSIVIHQQFGIIQQNQTKAISTGTTNVSLPSRSIAKSASQVGPQKTQKIIVLKSGTGAGQKSIVLQKQPGVVVKSKSNVGNTQATILTKSNITNHAKNSQNQVLQSCDNFSQNSGIIGSGTVLHSQPALTHQQLINSGTTQPASTYQQVMISDAAQSGIIEHEETVTQSPDFGVAYEEMVSSVPLEKIETQFLDFTQTQNNPYDVGFTSTLHAMPASVTFHSNLSADPTINHLLRESVDTHVKAGNKVVNRKRKYEAQSAKLASSGNETSDKTMVKSSRQSGVQFEIKQGGDGRFYCPKCPNSYTQKGILRQHFRHMHTSMAPR